MIVHRTAGELAAAGLDYSLVQVGGWSQLFRCAIPGLPGLYLAHPGAPNTPVAVLGAHDTLRVIVPDPPAPLAPADEQEAIAILRAAGLTVEELPS